MLDSLFYGGIKAGNIGNLQKKRKNTLDFENSN
jgi:hypothetical protein